jgi:RNA polymerase sigma factor (sigma-70 family)
MAINPMSQIIQHLRRTVIRGDGAGLTDGQLLERYLHYREDAAFAALVRRHGPMVMSVCRRILGNDHDAEDAFQASFLVLVRKAASVVPREKVANFLYGVAHTTAVRAKGLIAKRQAREKQVTEMPEPEARPPELWDDLRPLLDQELSRLPDKYRVPIVLCDLEDRPIKEAARQLGWPQGTLAGRLARARVMLAKRLTRRGLMVSGGALAAVVSQNAVSAAVPTSLMSTTVKAAAVIAAGQAAVAGVVPAKVAALMEGVLKTMLMTKLKSLMPVTMAMLAIMVGVGVGLLGYGRATGQQKDGNKAEVVAPNKEVAKNDKDQLLGKWLLISCKCNGKDRMEPWFKDNSRLDIEEADGKLVCKTVFKDKAKLIERFGGEEIEKRMLWADMAGESPAKVIERFGEEMEKNTQGILKLDARTKPKTLDVISAVPSNGIYLGIYKLDGDTLTWCWSKALTPEVAKTGKDRPNDFSTTSGDGRTLTVYKRQKETEPKSRDSSLVPAKKTDAGKTDLDRLQGVWSVVSIEQGGKPSKLEKAVFMVDGKRACLQGSDKEIQGGLYLEPASKPKTFDLAMSTRTIEGIYSLEGNTLRLCYGVGGDEPKRPGSFTTEKGSHQKVLIMFKRMYGPEIFPFRLLDGTRAFPTIVEGENMEFPTPPMIAPQPKASKPSGGYGGYNDPPLIPPQPKDNKP